MLAGSVDRAPNRRTLTLTKHSHFTDHEPKFEQFHLYVVELSPPAPYFSTRIRRSCSSSTRIFSSAYCSRLFSCAISSTSVGGEGMTFPAAFEIAIDVGSGFSVFHQA
jgi:hypothetical protein